MSGNKSCFYYYIYNSLAEKKRGDKIMKIARSIEAINAMHDNFTSCIKCMYDGTISMSVGDLNRSRFTSGICEVFKSETESETRMMCLPTFCHSPIGRLYTTSMLLTKFPISQLSGQKLAALAQHSGRYIASRCIGYRLHRKPMFKKSANIADPQEGR